MSIDECLVSLMDAHEQRLYTFLLMLLRNHAPAEDCTRDTFWRAYENLREGKPVHALWLFMVARDRAMEELRHQVRIRPGQGHVEPIASTDECDNNHGVWQAIRRLPDSDCEVLYLFAVEWFKTDEIGMILHVRERAVRRQLCHARQCFQALCER
ncbi:MAG: RNA polymerase sigma factor [Chloroflexota bacterium]